MKKIIVAALAAVAVVPATASAHTAKVVCTPTQFGVEPSNVSIYDRYEVKDGYVFVYWTDGYKVRLPIPQGCTYPLPPVTPPVPPPAEPTPAPVPPTPEVIPPGNPIEPLPVILPGPDKPPVKRVPLKATKRIITVKVVGCPARPYTVRQVIVTWKRGDTIVKTKRSTPRKVWTRVICRIPAVTG